MAGDGDGDVLNLDVPLSGELWAGTPSPLAGAAAGAQLQLLRQGSAPLPERQPHQLRSQQRHAGSLLAGAWQQPESSSQQSNGGPGASGMAKG